MKFIFKNINNNSIKATNIYNISEGKNMNKFQKK